MLESVKFTIESKKDCVRIAKCIEIVIKIRLICASCVMFADHKKHDVISLKEGVIYLRNTIAKELKKGKLRKDFTESHVLDIREYHLKLEKFKNDTIKKIDDIFKELIQTLKTR